MQAVETAVNTMSALTGSWGTTISGISAAVTYMAGLQTPAANPFTSEAFILRKRERERERRFQAPPLYMSHHRMYPAALWLAGG